MKLGRALLPWLLLPIAAAAGFALARARPAWISRDTATANGSPSLALRTGTAAAAPAVGTGTPTADHPRDRQPVDPVADIARRIESFPRPEIAPSSATITGIVLDDKGAPLAGVLVRAMADLPRDLYLSDWSDVAQPTPPPEVFVARGVDELVEWLARDLAFRREAGTGPDGEFVLTGLFDVDYRIQAFAEGWIVNDGDDVDDVRPGDRVVLHAAPVAAVTVDVVDAEGRFAERAWVFSDEADDDPLAYDGWVAVGLQWSPAKRTIHVPRGRRSFRAKAGTRVSPIVVAEAETGANVLLELRPAGTIRVVPTWDPNGPDDDVVEFTATALDGSAAEPLAGGRGGGSAVEFANVPAGRWRVEVRIREGRTLFAKDVDVTSGTVDVRLAIPPFGPADGFPVRGEDASGRLTEDASIGTDADDVEVIETGPGTWFVLVRDRTPGREIEVSARTSPRLSARVAADRTEDLVLRLEPTSDMAVDVDGPALDDELVLRRLDGGQNYVQDHEPDEDGRAWFSSVPHGLYELRTSVPEVAGAMRVWVNGPTRVHFDPVPFRALRVRELEDDGAAAAWGLQEDDLVFGIDGEPFENFLHMEAVAAAAALRGTATLDVLRGRRRVSVVADLIQIRAGTAGADLEPAILD